MNSSESLEAIAIGLWARLFPDRNIDEASHFFELGGDSMAAINFLVAMERETGFVIPIGTLYRAPVLGQFVKQIAGSKQEEKWPVVTPLQVQGLKVPLFVIAPAIGGVLHYKEFTDYLPSDQPCYCLEPRISSAGEHRYESVEEIAEWKIKAMKDLQVEGPYRLCGYSFGGSIAWEMAKQLQAQGETVEMLLAFDTIARGIGYFHLRHQGSLFTRIKNRLNRLRAYRNSYRRHGASLSLRNVCALIWVKVSYLFNKAATPGDRTADLQAYAEEMEEVVQNSLRGKYDYGTYDGELILLRAEQQLLLRRELDYELGWSGRALQGLRIIDVPGDHLTLMYGDEVKRVAEKTIELLQELPIRSVDIRAENEEVETLPYPEESVTSPVDRFKKVVEHAGSRNAILDQGRFFSFQELDAFSDSICHWISQIDASGCEGIAVYLENSYTMCAAFLGVLKSGRYYVPLDPEHPEERTTQILQESGVGLVITEDALKEQASQLVDTSEIEVISLSKVPHEISETVEVSPIDPEAPAVILFTSGSTGKPKGVLHNNRSVAYVGWRRGVGIGVEATDRYLSIYSGAFMGFLNGFYASIQFGSCFCFYRLRARGLEGLAAWLNANHISIFHSVTSVYRNFVSGLPKGVVLTTIRSVTPGGEPSRHSDIDQFKEHFQPGTVYYANLGSSETGSISFEPIYHDTVVPKQIPVGVPFEELNLTIRDASGNNCAVNEEGEICLSTNHIFSGYWKDEEKTNEVLSREPDGTPLFRSGDYGLLTEDGRLVNLGRKDNQIKINGYRMEIPDVESSFMKLSEIGEIAVIAREDETANDMLRLYAFYRLHEEGKGISKEAVRERLLEHLPTPMIPNYLFEMDALPKNPTGKVDRKELLKISREKTGGSAAG